jgi:alpha-glucosidase (family GH31 glycosyl hydrolase)
VLMDCSPASPADTFALDEQLMLGPAVLVRPVLTAGASHADVLLPRTSRW